MSPKAHVLTTLHVAKARLLFRHKTRNLGGTTENQSLFVPWEDEKAFCLPTHVGAGVVEMMGGDACVALVPGDDRWAQRRMVLNALRYARVVPGGACY